jgi:hypothetical protein
MSNGRSDFDHSLDGVPVSGLESDVSHTRIVQFPDNLRRNVHLHNDRIEGTVFESTGDETHAGNTASDGDADNRHAFLTHSQHQRILETPLTSIQKEQVQADAISRLGPRDHRRNLLSKLIFGVLATCAGIQLSSGIPSAL